MSSPLASLLAIQSRQQPTVDALASRQLRLDEMRRMPGPNADIGQTQADIAGDPIVGDVARAELAYNAPAAQAERETAKQDALQKLLEPIRLKGEYDVRAEGIRGDAAVRAAEARATNDDARLAQQLAISDANRAATDARARSTQNAITQRTIQMQQMKEREARAKNAETTGMSAYNPMHWLFGKPTGQEQAAQIRAEGQQAGGGDQFDSADTPDNIAAEMFAQRPDATPEMIQYALGQMGVTDPAAIQAVAEAYQSLQGGR